MRLLFDLGHPAHVHLFRNLISRVQKDGGEVLALTRKKDVTVHLCQHYGIPQRVLSRAYAGGILAGTVEFFIRTLRLLGIALRFKPNALLGTSMSIGLVGRLIGCTSFVFNEDDADVVPLFAKIAYPACDYIVTPDCLRHENHGRKHLTYPGFHELAYLHPEHFTPDPLTVRNIGLKEAQPFFILRFVALKAHHDTHARGLSLEVVRKLLDILKPHGRVVITAEGGLPDEFVQYEFPLTPEKFHHVLAFASMVVSDSQTVTAEAAVLGIPNLRTNTFVGRITYLEKLEKNFGLTKGFLPHESDKLFGTVQDYLLDLKNAKAKMQRRRNKMLSDCINVADWQWDMLVEMIHFGKNIGTGL